MADYTLVTTPIVADIEFYKESIRVAIITDTHEYQSIISSFIYPII